MFLHLFHSLLKLGDNGIGVSRFSQDFTNHYYRRNGIVVRFVGHLGAPVARSFDFAARPHSSATKDQKDGSKLHSTETVQVSALLLTNADARTIAGKRAGATGLASARLLGNDMTVTKPSLLICIPSYNSQLLTPFVCSLFNLSTKLGQMGIPCEISIQGDSFLPRLRNYFASSVLRSNHTHLLMIDNDIEFAPDAVVDMLNSGKELIAAACARKVYNWDRLAVAARVGIPASELREAATDVIVWSGTETYSNAMAREQLDIVPVDATGTGIMLANRKVFEKIRDAHPELEYRLDQFDKTPFWNFFGPYIDENKILLADDYSFCRRAASVGVQPYLFTRYRSVHHGTHGFVFNKQARQEVDARVAAINTQ
jgi:hypothetical protein